MRQIFSILILVSWILSTLSTHAEPTLVLDHSSHIQTIHKKNSESETPDHYQSFSEIDLKDERSKLLFFNLILFLTDINDLYLLSIITSYSQHSYDLNEFVIFPPHCPLYIADRQILI